ncbi:MAG TPA: hypothetical protein VE954_01875 [Oligoflexus sp.]|uniref:hypothetical protein n=1 Tax=Oligoflexus sp. TaxID=1971216 RepID=UPI002D553068|nr:hypothetical protein [Oligoflexus sp.]HYX31833.1 hypothetical protein [Oligoflexus sp.]
MSQVLGLLIWIGVVTQLLLGIRLVGKATDLWAEAFQADYAMAVCGRYQAMAANLRSAVATWRKLGCAEGEDVPVDLEVETVLMDWKEFYVDQNMESCALDGPLRVKLHRERNPDLDADYPNWVVRYE